MLADTGSTHKDYYHGGKYTFLRWAGLDLNGQRDGNNPRIQEFYNNATIVASFHAYVEALLTRRNRHNNLTYAEDPAVFAYETGNELEGPVSRDTDVPADWVRGLARLIRHLAPTKLFVDGTYGLNDTHLALDEVDIFSNHYYPIDAARLRADAARVAAAGRTYFAGEYDWTGRGEDGSGADRHLDTFYAAIEEDPAVCGDTFWSLFGRNLPDCNVST